MSFVNFNNKEELSSRKYTKTVVLAALLEAETKNIVKAKNMIANLAEEVELNEALSLFSDKIGAMRTLDYVANLYQPVLEGQFSWLTHDTAQQIGSERENTIQVWMFDNQGNMWFEKNYAGYGEFGGMDYYELVAKMNGYSDEDLDIKIGKRNKLYRELREIGIALAFGELETRDRAGKVLFPALMADPKGFNYKRWDFSEEAPNDPNQSWYVEPEYDEEEWEEEYESKNEALDFNDPVLMAFRAAKAERDARLAAAASAPKKAKLYGKKRSEAEDKLWTISQELKDLYSDRTQLLNDMEAEAGELGMEEFEKSGKHDQYGGELNTIEDKIQDLLAKRGQLEMRLAESVNSNVDNSIAINENWGTFDTPEGKMVAKELDKAWNTFAKTVNAAHNEWLKVVQKYRGDAGKGSGFSDSEGRDSVISAMEWYIEKVFMADNKFGGIDYRKYRQLMGESVEVNEAEVDIIPEVEGEFMQLYSKLNDLAEETTDTKWRKAIEGIIKGLEGVESKIGQTANKLGVVPTHEGNAFGAARAEAIAKGEKTFKVGSEEYDVEGVDKEDKENAKEFVGEDWGGSDQAAMNKSIHRDAGSPRQMPSPFDPKLRSAAENAVDFYWDEWPEYQDDRDGLIDNAVRSYLRTYFKDQFDALVRMFEEKEETVTEGRSINKIQKEWAEVTSMMKSTVEEWKKAEGDTKGSLLDKLKSLTARKNELEKELDGAVQLKDVDAELAEAKKPSWDALIEEFKMTNEDLRTDLKKYIKANEKELNELADNDNWDAIYDMLRNDFNVKEGSKEDEDLISTFNFIF